MSEDVCMEAAGEEIRGSLEWGLGGNALVGGEL